MMRKITLLAPVLACLGMTGDAQAQSVDYMTEDCALASRQFFEDFEAKANLKYQGQRTDGTHAVNGTISLENRSEDFQCSYGAGGTEMVDFFAQNESQKEFVAGNGNSSGSDSSDAPTPAQQACLRDVSNSTNNPVVVVLESQFSEAGTLVVVGVGETNARWNCIAYKDGTTDGIMSLTDEGSN